MTDGRDDQFGERIRCRPRPDPRGRPAATSMLSTTTPTTAGRDAAAISRPDIDPAVCGNGSKLIIESTNITCHPFGFGTKTPIPLQVVASASGGVAKPFAVVVRLYAVGVNGDGALTIQGTNGASAPTPGQVTNAGDGLRASLPEVTNT